MLMSSLHLDGFMGWHPLMVLVALSSAMLNRHEVKVKSAVDPISGRPSGISDGVKGASSLEWGDRSAYADREADAARIVRRQVTQTSGKSPAHVCHIAIVTGRRSAPAADGRVSPG